MKSWFYYFMRLVLKFPLKMMYRRIYVDGLENVPKNKPILICSNHPNSFLDGVIYCTFMTRKVQILTRGDVFLKPIPNKILRAMLLLPIFRARDASAEVARKGNLETFKECIEMFKLNRALVIFSEGDAYPEKSVRTIKNGTLKLATDSFLNSNCELDIHIQPAGINYEYLDQSGGSIHFSFEKPMKLMDFKSEIIENQNQFVVEKRSFIEENIKKLTVHAKGDTKVERNFLHDLFLNEPVELPIFKIENAKAHLIPKQIENVMASDIGIELIQKYRTLLSKYKITDRLLSANSFDLVAVLVGLFTFMQSIPFFLINFIGFWFVGKLVKKKIKNVVFRNSMHIAFNLIVFLLSLIAFASIYFVKEGMVWGLIYTSFAVVGGYMWARILWDLPYFAQLIKRLSIPKEDIDSLKKMRTEIINISIVQ